MPPLEIGVTSWFLAKLLRMKLITDLNDDWESSFEFYLKRYIPRIMMRPLFKLADRIYSSSSCIFAVTPTLAKTVRQRGINSPLILAPNGADTSIFRPQSASVRKRTRSTLALPQNKIVVAYTGSSIDPYYRLDLVLSSIRSLSTNKEVPFFFVFYLINGIEPLRKLRDHAGISKELVDIREPLPRDKLSMVLASCDVGLVPFDDESFLLYAMSSKVYEYLSTGLYVVSTGPKSGELDKFFSQNESLGLFASPKAKDLAFAISNMIENAARLFDDSSRNFRHLFIKKYYDRQKTMMEAMARARRLVQR
jgi:glycosyltransferase involved in cell wall biosynthesis